ncbi:hypothetical protein [Aeoliella sp.]|uniref:hypothetical protein n=1 Tax=Aeoliella sp. TaxID=2795800 RepID=UPI003CCBF1A5
MFYSKFQFFFSKPLFPWGIAILTVAGYGLLCAEHRDLAHYLLLFAGAGHLFEAYRHHK